MTSQQEEAFYAASGFHASSISTEIRLLVGVIAIIVALLVLAGLMHLLDSASPWDKFIFMLSIFGLSFVLMLIFIYLSG